MGWKKVEDSFRQGWLHRNGSRMIRKLIYQSKCDRLYAYLCAERNSDHQLRLIWLKVTDGPLPYCSQIYNCNPDTLPDHYGYHVLWSSVKGFIIVEDTL